MAKRDWAALTVAFVAHNGTLEDFAKMKKIPLSTIRKKSGELGWLEKRRKNGTKTERISLDLVADNKAMQLAEQNQRDLEAVRLVHDKAVDMLSACDKASDLKALSGALKDIQTVARLALGVSTENSNVNLTDDFEGWLNERIGRG